MREIDRDVLELVYGLAAALVRLHKELNDAIADRNMWKNMYLEVARKTEPKQE